MSTSTQWQLAQEAAERYQHILVPAILGPAARALVDWSALQKSDTVLDVGCGTGAAARYAAEQVGASGRVTGVDVNAGMIAVARSLPPVTGAAIEWQEQNAYQLPLSESSVDVVLCAQTLQFLHDRRLALTEIVRVLKPGGRAALSLWSALDESPYFHVLVSAISRPIAPETAMGLKAAFGLSNMDEIHALLTEAGFRNIEMNTGQIDLDLPELAEFVPRHISATPMAAGFNAASPEAQQAVIKEVSGQLAGYKSDAGVRIPFRTHLAMATKPKRYPGGSRAAGTG